MDLIATTSFEEGGQHVHGWENVTLLEEEATTVADKTSGIALS